MRILTLSSSGNVGKTVIAEHLLAPRLEDTLLIRFGGLRDQTTQKHWEHREEISEMFADLLEYERCIVDVVGGATKRVLAGIHRFASIHNSIDYFVIPVISSAKVQLETIALLDRLAGAGIETGRVRVAFNRVDPKVGVENEFGILLNHISTHGGANANSKAVIFENELFDILAEENLTIRQVMEDDTDYKALLHEQKNADDALKAHWSNRFGIKCLTKHVKRDLDACYAELIS
jgi:hypothetical protein